MANRFGTAASQPVVLKVSAYALWGENGDGQSIPDDNPYPKAVALGWYHNLNLSSDGKVTAWGDNSRGQCEVPPGLSNVVAVSGGAYHSLALKADGTVVTWGQELYNDVPMPEGLSNVVAISAGGFHNLALKSDGTVAAWGYNWEHQCDVPVGLSLVVAIAAGWYHGLALKRDGTVVAWGENAYGQSTIPGGLNGVLAIAAGGNQSLAIFDAQSANRPPIAANYPFGTQRDQPIALGVGLVLDSCDDPDGDALSLTAVSAASAAGGTAVLSENWIIYTPPSGFTGIDTFS